MPADTRRGERIVFVLWAPGIIFSLSNLKKKGISVGSHIYLWTRSPVQWLMTSPKLRLVLDTRMQNNTENKSLYFCQPSYLLFVSICLPVCASSSLQNSAQMNVSSKFISLFTLLTATSLSKQGLKQRLHCYAAKSNKYHLFPPVFVSLILSLSDHTQRQHKEKLCGEREKGGRERKQKSGRVRAGETTGNKSPQINVLHRRCSQNYQENLKAGREQRTIAYTNWADGLTDGWMGYIRSVCVIKSNRATAPESQGLQSNNQVNRRQPYI